jgi:hypothetical protein
MQIDNLDNMHNTTNSLKNNNHSSNDGLNRRKKMNYRIELPEHSTFLTASNEHVELRAHNDNNHYVRRKSRVVSLEFYL